MTATPPVTHCKKGHEYTPENTRYKSDGRKLCKACTDFCKYGHEYTPENTRIRPNGTRRCRACDRAVERKRAAPRGCIHGIRKPMLNCIECRYAQSVHASISQGGSPRSYDDYLGNKNPLDYLTLTPEQAQASRDFNFAVDTKGRPLCETPSQRKVDGRIVDYYFHADFDIEKPPSVVEAAKACMGCPVLEQCDPLGIALNAGKSKADGIYAGKVYVNGKLVNNKKQ